MKRTVRRSIVIETEQIQISFNSNSLGLMICRECERDKPMIPVEKIAEKTIWKLREIFRLVEAGKVHFFEREDGKVFVCLESLGKTAGGEIVQI
jgi:hypothetical protein